MVLAHMTMKKKQFDTIKNINTKWLSLQIKFNYDVDTFSIIYRKSEMKTKNIIPLTKKYKW